MPYRTICDVLNEMRSCYKTRNFSYLPGLIEELQTMGNRMEAALEEYQYERSNTEKVKRARKILKQDKPDEEIVKELKGVLKRYG